MGTRNDSKTKNPADSYFPGTYAVIDKTDKEKSLPLFCIVTCLCMCVMSDSTNVNQTIKYYKATCKLLIILYNFKLCQRVEARLSLNQNNISVCK